MPRSGASRTLSTGERILRALELIVTRGPDLSVKELASQLGVSLSTAYHLVHTLAAAGYAVLEPHRSLRPGPALYRLLERVVLAPPRPEAVEPLVDEIGRVTGCRAYLAVWDDRDVEIVYVHGRRGARELPGLARGFRGAAHALALGKVLLAERPRQDWPVYLHADTLPARTPFTITEASRLAAELDAVRRDGIAYDREEFALGSCCLAVPLPSAGDGTGRQLALGISVPERRFAYEHELLGGVLRQLVR